MAEAQREEIAKLEALYAAHPEGRVFTHLAEAYRRAGELGRAREILVDGLRRHPDYSSAHVVFGRVLMDQEDTTAAATAFRRVLELDRHNLVALRSLGDLAERSGDRAAAVGYYRDLIALDPTDDRLRLTVARLEEELAAAELGAAVPDAGEDEEPPTGLPAEGEQEPIGMFWAESPTTGPAEPEEAAAADFPDLSADPAAADEMETGVSLPMLGEGEAEEPFAFQESPLEVEGLSLGWDATDAPPDASPPEGFETAEPAVDDAIEAPELVPDSFAGMGWTAGEAADTRPDEEARTEAETEPVGDEALSVDDAAWASVGERAEATWNAPAEEPEPALAGGEDDVEEITTWGPPTDEISPEPDEMPELLETAEDREAELWEAPPDAAGSEAEAAVDEIEPEPAPASPAGAGAGEMLTATMAELYAQQGFYDRAVDVYRQLVEQVPEDERLRQRLAEIELLGRAAGTELDESEAEAASVWTGAGGVAGGEETPYAWADSATGDEVDDPERTAGAYFRSLLAWRPAEGASGADGGVLELTDDEAAAAEGERAPELDTGAVAAAFEEWFGEGAAEGAQEGSGGEAETDEAAEEDADLAMFRSWLQSLKK